MNLNRFRSNSSRSLVRARVAVAVTAVMALVGVVIVAPAAFGAVPNAPGQPVLTPGDGQISVAFTAPAGGADSYSANCASSDGGAAGSFTGPASPVVVANITNGRTYTCTVTASNTTDGSGPPSPASTAVIPGVPGTPSAPTANPGNAAISVAFTTPPFNGSPITNIAATCTSANGGVTTPDNGTVSPITVSPVTNGKAYTCAVTATNGNGPGAASPASNSVTPGTVPSAPAQPTATAGNAQITVGFTSAANGGLPVTGYTATCSGAGATTGTSTGSTPSIVVGGLDYGKSYTCTVFASNDNGDGSPSVPSAAVTVPSRAPDAPNAPTVTPGGGEATVAFTPRFNGGSPITGYTATCVRSDDGSFGGVSGPNSPIVVLSLKNGMTYSCSVTATNAKGTSSPSPSVSVIPAQGPDAPPRPAVAAGDRRINVGFSAPGNGGSPITGYTAICTTGNVHVSKGGTTSPIVVTGLTNGRTYTCTIAAINANSTGDASPASAPVIPSTVPSVPGIPGVRPGNGSISVSFGAPNNGGTAITSYVTSCGSTNGGHPASRAGTTSPLVVTGLTNDKSYRCVVTAHNVRGNSAPSGASALTVPSALLTIQSTQRGFRLFAGDGGVFTFGVDTSFGSAAGVATHTVVGMSSTPDTKGYWLVATDGGIFSFGDAHFWGSTGAMHLNQPIVGMTTTPSGHGYWLVASDGGIFSFGDAHFWGSTGAIRLNQPIVGMSSTPTGHGYWLVAADGGLFSFGDAGFHGAPTGHTHATVVGMATTGKGGGYWIAAADGAVYNFGDAPAYGGVTVRATRLPIAGIASTPTGRGYWLAAGDGGVFTFGDAPFIGWPGPLVLRQPIRGVNR